MPQASDPSTPASGTSISRAQSSGVLVAAVLAAVSNFVLMWLGLNTLGDEAAGTEFLVDWSLLTGMFGVVSGVQNEATRAAGAVAAGRPPGTRILTGALVAGAAVAALLAMAWPLLAHRVLPISAGRAVPLLLVTSIAYAAYVTLVGGLAGHGWWTPYAALLCGEVLARLALMVLVFGLGASLVGYEAAAAGATAVVLACLLVSGRARRAIASRADVALRGLLRNLALAMASTACTAVLVTAYPTLLRATNVRADAVAVGSLIAGISLTRAPIMMPLTSFQSVAIRAFQAHRDEPLRALGKPAAALLALGLAGAVAAWPVGRWFLPLFHAGYQLPGWVFSALTFSSALMAVLTIAGTLVLALDSHRAYVAGWLVAAAVSIGTLVMPWALAPKAVLSLAAGPLAGIGVLVWWLRRTARAEH